MTGGLRTPMLGTPVVGMTPQASSRTHRNSNSGLISGLSPVSSPRRRNKARIHYVKGDENINFAPDPRPSEMNGWQGKYNTIKARAAAVFNSYTVADVLLYAEGQAMPAHSYILASSSATFFSQLHEEQPLHDISFLWQQQSSVEGREYGHIRWHLHVKDVPYIVLFHFIRFLYTDEIEISLDNVVHLLNLAHSYKVGALTSKCQEFLRLQVTPKDVLRVLYIAKRLLLKSILQAWSEYLAEQKVSLQMFGRTITRRHNGMDSDEGSIASGSRMGSKRLNSRMHGATTPRAGNSGSPPPRPRSRASSVMSFLDNDDADSVMLEDMQFASWAGASRALDGASGFSLAGTVSHQGVAAFCQHLVEKCWKCIELETEAVLATPEMMEQDQLMLSQILRLDPSSASEISLFRTVLLWARHQCKLQGIQDCAENLREVVGEECLNLVRFAALTAEQIEWEVVPSGILPYHDIQQLLYTLHGKSAVLGKYSSEKRAGGAEYETIAAAKMRQAKTKTGNVRTLLESTPEGDLAQHKCMGNSHAFQELVRGVYNKHPSDHIDNLLCNELLRVALMRANEQDAIKSGARHLNTAPLTRLPPITPRSLSTVISSSVNLTTDPLSAGSSMMTIATTHTRKSYASGRPTVRSIPQTLLLGVPSKNIDEVSNAALMRDTLLEDVRYIHASDFVRLGSGFYRFKNSRLLEIWVQEGTARCKDHGPIEYVNEEAIQQLGEDCSAEEERRLRDELGIGLLDKSSRWSSGVPLLAFLQQQT